MCTCRRSRTYSVVKLRPYSPRACSCHRAFPSLPSLDRNANPTQMNDRIRTEGVLYYTGEKKDCTITRDDTEETAFGEAITRLDVFLIDPCTRLAVRRSDTSRARGGKLMRAIRLSSAVRGFCSGRYSRKDTGLFFDQYDNIIVLLFGE